MNVSPTKPFPCQISPVAYAGLLADSAITKLNDAAAYVTGPQPLDMPLPPNPGGMPAVRAANEAVAIIDNAINFGTAEHFDTAVLDAFQAARTQALAGVTQLTSLTLRPLDPKQVAMQFNASAMYLGIAKELLGFGEPRLPMDPVRPPHPAPNERVGVKLPAPDAEIQ